MSSIPASPIRLAFYADKYKNLTVKPEVVPVAKEIAGKINQNIIHLGMVSKPFNIPAWVPGALLNMEASMDFGCHLANGDPLTGDTVHVPLGIMAKYFPELKPPFDFITAGMAALIDYKTGWGHLTITDIPSALSFFDCYNGLGCWEMDPVNPQIAYLFSGTDAYEKGKFASDNTWDPEEVSQQVGVAAILKALGL